MPIPDFDENGLLPPGMHDCTLQEIGDRFGRFRTSNRRPELYAKLQSYLTEVKNAQIIHSLIIEGSFVTSKPAPENIDFVIVMVEDHDFHAEIRPFQYNVISKRRIRRQYGFDTLIARVNSDEYTEFVAFFQQVRDQPDLKKAS
jgi:hypothetical protein